MNTPTLTNKEVLDDLDSRLENLIVRDFLSKMLKNYNYDETYIIYDGNIIEVFDKSIFDVKQTFGHFKSYFISRPVRLPGRNNSF